MKVVEDEAVVALRKDGAGEMHVEERDIGESVVAGESEWDGA